QMSDAEWQIARSQAAQWHAQRGAAQWTPPAFSTQAPSKSHRRRSGVIAAGALVVVAAGMTATVVMRDTPAEASYSLTAATAATNAASTLSYSFEMSTAGSTISGEASMDIDEELMSMTMKTDELPRPVDMIFDLDANNLYMEAGLYEDLGLPIDGAEWIEFDIDELADVDMSSMMSGVGENPLDATAMFESADDVVDLGYDHVEGQRVKHYQITIDQADALGTDFGAHAFVNEGADTDSTVFDAYVTEDNDLVRLTYGQQFMGEFATMDITVTGVGEPVDIQVPHGSSVVQSDDLGLNA
ncbi:MAG: putative lipoprotein, partial [Ilumatobacteraceae bacterium]|nr:putative lipoprotein [Ilumatobacteraceae bacterium]